MKTMDRFVYQELFYHILGTFYNGEEIDYVREVEYDGQFYENETFMIRDYDWNEDDEVGKNEYHFHHKPTDLKIYWYKYPMRSPKTNFEVTPQQFLTVLYDCRNSLNTNINSNIDKHVWWNKGTNERTDNND